MYVSTAERKELIQEINGDAYILYEYYVSKAGIDNFEYSDKRSARTLGWKERKAKDIRLRLTKKHWYHQATGKLSNGQKIKITFLGKEAVNEQIGAPENIFTQMARGKSVMDELNLSTEADLKANLNEAQKLYEEKDTLFSD